MTTFKIAITAALALTLTTSAAMAEKRDYYKREKIFQNVAAEHVQPLLANTAWVLTWWTGKNKKRGGYLSVVWYASDGTAHGCSVNANTGKSSRGAWNATYTGRTVDRKRRDVRQPLFERVRDGERIYKLLRYNGNDGALATYKWGKNRWMETHFGHLQARIPAVTWENCPDFPSAESLGAEVNTRQTSRYYNELLKQDPGARILRPQYVNECAHEWYGKKADKNCQAVGGN
ncbi:hypothetical protein [uncultured Ruegeria sp.]|uniref:hypothetical protein n=1 Tax=uncultured Ruegeria sp. TaxID=259304 RepID=UPI00261BBEBB|nr:hypothetical protein [uncultured Ruegeria sp.]